MEEKGYVLHYDRREGGKNADKCINFGVSVETVPNDGFKFPHEVKEGERSISLCVYQGHSQLQHK